ncbi:probable isoaspartyl peptidase/L-asparaginase GA20639 [Fopius arisanus]|uniref:Probable isoaspartyl peptidase/L-asparaginase GA20639 n=1 Tax=Fopius arisanus TaxID=64838 RepID=A0A9R1TZ58_9HYME|nr:PREDICTED: probable isoaspartyl peptidase/L-asparaginase GA20639 [Fopius arisanus]
MKINFNKMNSKSPCIIVHGGITHANDPWIMEKISAVVKSASRGYSSLISNQNAVDAVEDALWWLENDEFLNCGYGCSPNDQDLVEMDASMMNGTTSQSGTILCLKDVEHPISVARYVMENYSNKIFSNELMKRMKNIPRFWMPPGNMDPVSERDNEVKNHSCGCISWDGLNLVVGSTGGGPRGKPSGAVSDAGIIGCGLFASETLACVITGPTDSLVQLNLASEVVDETEELNACPETVLKKHVNLLKAVGEAAGGIILHSSGCTGIYFTAPCMPYAVVKDECIVYGWDMCQRHYRKYSNVDGKNICRCNIEMQNF